MFGQITEFEFFEKINFFLFCGVPKNFFDPQRPYLALKTSLFGGVILLKHFDPSYGFKVIDFDIAIFWQN